MSDTSNSYVLELSSYTQPSIIEDSRNAWVEYGEDNNYYSTEDINLAIIDKLVRLLSINPKNINK